MATANSSREELLEEIESLRFRLEEAEDTLRAIGSGEVDAFVVSGPEGEQVFTLKGAEQSYRILVETMNEGAATLAADGTILYCNSRLAAILHVPLEQLVGMQFDSYVAPTDRPVFLARLGKCHEECDKDEIALINGAGTAVPTMISCCALDLSSNREISLVVTDLTQQKRSEEIVAAGNLARSIIDQAGEAIIVCDGEGRVIRTNRLAMQLCVENPLLQPFDEQIRLRVADTECLFSVLTPLQGGCFESVEVEFIRKEDQILHLILNATPLMNAQQCIIGCVVTLTDITERKLAEEALQRMNDELEDRVAVRTAELAANIEKLELETAERMKAVEALREKEQMLIQQSRQAAMGEMIGNIAHQWRQPLNSLGLVVQQLLLFYDMGEFSRELLEENVTISKELIKHMSTTIDDFRSFFRPDKEKAEFKVSEAVTSALSLIDDSFKNQHIAVEVIAKDEPDIFGYQNEYGQVLLNILNNARDALTERGPEDPKVTITIGNEENKVVVTIADNAGGIPVEIKDKIFDPYFTTKGPQQGTGVGLFMSKTIIEKNMGGRITARNTAGGAEFRIEV